MPEYHQLGSLVHLEATDEFKFCGADEASWQAIPTWGIGQRLEQFSRYSNVMV